MRPITVTQTSYKKVLDYISRGKKLWRLYNEASVKIKSNPSMPSQIKEYFTSVFNKASEGTGGGKWSECIGNETIELEITKS